MTIPTGKRAVSIYSQGKRNYFVGLILRIRNTVKEKIDLFIPRPYNAILSALLIGFRSGIPDHIRDNFVQTGTVQVLPTQKRGNFNHSFRKNRGQPLSCEFSLMTLTSPAIIQPTC